MFGCLAVGLGRYSCDQRQTTMVKAKKGGRGAKKVAAQPVYDSDDERAYEGEAVPDKAADDYFNDEVDQFHANKEKLLLQKGAPYGHDESEESQEEVMAFSDSEEEAMYEAQLNRLRSSKVSEDLASDIEEDKADKDLSDDRAWGKLKSKFYGADVEDEEDIEFSGSEDGVAALEEQEAINLQRKMAEQLDDDDFGLGAFQAPPKEAEGEKDEAAKVVKDMSKLSKHEKRELLKKECPELLGILEDYKAKLLEYIHRLGPLLELVKAGCIPAASSGAQYVQTKASLVLNYCVNVQFYLQLRSKQLPVRHHPVMKRLVQYRNLMKQLEPIEDNLKSEVDDILKKIETGEEVRPRAVMAAELKRPVLDKVGGGARIGSKVPTATKISNAVGDRTTDASLPSSKRRQGDLYETAAEKEALEFYKMMKPGASASGDRDVSDEEPGEIKGADASADEDEGDAHEDTEDGDINAKRAVTYQIVKNRGLTPRRKKEYKNPRVKHRIKYQKAKVRRKGQVREVRKELLPYGGEISGIRAGVKRGIRLKS